MSRKKSRQVTQQKTKRHQEMRRKRRERMRATDLRAEMNKREKLEFMNAKNMLINLANDCLDKKGEDDLSVILPDVVV